MYIDVGSKFTNKAIFQILFSQKDEIERTLGEHLSWERLDTKSAARIALYHPESVNIEPDKDLIPWATDAVVRMIKALSVPTKKALDEAGR